MKLKNILNHYFIYNLYQKIIGADNYLKRYIKNYIHPQKGDKILELACGAGNVYSLFPLKDVYYTGIEYSQNYVAFAKKKYPEQTFICADVTQDFKVDNEYDIIYAEAIISAIPDEKVLKMFELIKKCSNSKTRIILSDMNYRKSAPFIERFLMENERNEYVRTKEDYIKLISNYFKIDKISIDEKPYNIPYQKIIFECSLL